MIDTVILTIPFGSYRVLYPERFFPNYEILLGRGNFLLKCVNNPTDEDWKNEIYKPRLTATKRMTRRGIEIPLKIEFSAPKMIFGNNMDELKESDFDNVLNKLGNQLLDMGVVVSGYVLRKSSVSAVHFSKNIKIEDGYTVKFIIRELHKIKISKKLDLTKVTFRNDGNSLQCYSKSHSLVIYDKVSDLNSRNKAIDGDQTLKQLSLWEDIKTNRRDLEILRFEVRLSIRQKLKSVLKEIGNLNNNPILEDIFKKDICQKVVKLYWDKIIANENLFLFKMNNSPINILKEIIDQNPKIKPKEILYLLGLNIACKDEGGIQNLRSILGNKSTTRTWYRITEDIKKLNSKNDLTQYHSWVKQIDDGINKFEAFKLLTCDVKNSKVILNQSHYD